MKRGPVRASERTERCRRRLAGLLVWDALLGTAAILLGLIKMLEHHHLLPFAITWLTDQNKRVVYIYGFFTAHATLMDVVFRSRRPRTRCNHEIFTFKSGMQLVSLFALPLVFYWLGVRPVTTCFLLGMGLAYVFFSARYVRDILEAEPAELDYVDRPPV